MSLRMFTRTYHRRRKRKGLGVPNNFHEGFYDLRQYHAGEFRSKVRLYNHLSLRGFQDKADNLSIHPRKRLSWDWWY